MKPLFDTIVSKKTRREAPKVHGFYTAQEAAEQLGVDVSTLRYRRDAADAQSWWELIGVMESDETYRVLAESHQIIHGKHYYEIKLFDKFVREYLQRPQVQRARRAKTTWLTAHTVEPLTTVTISSDEQIDELAKVLIKLRMFSPNLSITITEKP